MERLLGLVKVFNVVAGIVLILGTVALVWLMVQRGASGPGQAEPLRLPAGTVIDAVASVAEGVVLLVRLPDGRQEVRLLTPSGEGRTLVEAAP